MLDEQAYSKIFNALIAFLRNNMSRYGRQFSEQLTANYDPRNGNQAYGNAVDLFNGIASQGPRLNGPNNNYLSDEQLFQIVGNFVENKFIQVMQAQGGYNNSQVGMGGNSMNNGNQLFGNRGQGMGMGGRQTSPVHAQDDGGIDPSRPMQPTATPQPSPTMFTPTPAAPSIHSSITYIDNPIDDIVDTNGEFAPVKATLVWADERPYDRKIVLAKRETFKHRDARFNIAHYGAYHQLILDDPLDVVKDFFTTVPDATLGSPFLARIMYNHLDILDVPTEDFQNVRSKCIQGLAQDPHTPLYKQVSQALDNMPRGPYKAMTEYLIEHINRGLHLACRLASQIDSYVKITEFDDLNELLSSSYKGPFVMIPEGRLKLERIVASALWNALAYNTSVMFTDNSYPKNALQSSPAVPYSMEGVYPNKYSIPDPNSELSQLFLTKLKEQELSRKSFVLSRRSVVITNVLGKVILPKMTKTPKIIRTPLDGLLDAFRLSYTDMRVDAKDETTVEPYQLDTDPAEQLENYYNDTTASSIEESDEFSRIKPTIYPVDQTIFAVQYGEPPEKYLMALDVFSTIDTTPDGNIILAKKDIPTISTNG